MTTTQQPESQPATGYDFLLHELIDVRLLIDRMVDKRGRLNRGSVERASVQREIGYARANLRRLRSQVEAHRARRSIA